MTSFGYYLNFSDWSDHKGRPTTNGQDGFQAMYNVWVSVANVTMSGKLTGGDVAIRQSGNSWGGIDKVAGLTISGDVNLSGTFYVVNRGQTCTVSGQMKVGAIKLSHDTTPSVLNLSHADNEIGELDVGRYWSAGGVTCKAKYAIGGAKVYTTTGDIGATSSSRTGSSRSSPKGGDVIEFAGREFEALASNDEPVECAEEPVAVFRNRFGETVRSAENGEA